MRQWKVERIATLSDEELANFINEIDDRPDCEAKEVVFIGDNTVKIRIYQVIYVEG